MRARVSIAVQDRTWRESLPFLDTAGLPERPLDERRAHASEVLALYRRVATEWSDPSGRVGLMVSPSAAQRCTPELLRSLAELGREFDLPFHVHVQESAAQYRSAPAMFGGRSAVAYLADLGCLGPRTTIAHAVWIDDRDLDRLAELGTTIAHNPVSNLRLGAGVARARAFLDAGVSVSLGTDGLTCNDSLDMLEVAKTALLVGSIAEADPGRWLAPSEVLGMATHAGGRANFGDDVGTLTVGAKADLALLDPDSFAFLPPNDALPQLINSARGRDVLHVFIDGRLVVDGGTPCLVDVTRAAASVRETGARLWEAAARTPQPQHGLIAPLRTAAIDALARSDEGAYRLIGRPPRLLRGTDGGD
jgi:cytosine/adenosine deaminase-related metal-dependent hydrolase